MVSHSLQSDARQIRQKLQMILGRRRDRMQAHNAYEVQYYMVQCVGI